MNTITIGVDLAKNVFSVCEMDAAGHVLRRLDLKRDAFVAWLAPLGTTLPGVGLAAAHYCRPVRHAIPQESHSEE